MNSRDQDAASQKKFISAGRSVELHKELLRATVPQIQSPHQIPLQPEQSFRLSVTLAAKRFSPHGTTCTKQQFGTVEGTIHLNPQQEQMHGKSKRRL
jgi:hypothetical protein